MIKAPIHIRIGANEDGFKSLSIKLVSDRSPRRRIWAVAVLPIFAPNTTGIACPSFMIPAFTKPMSMMVVAAELWIIAVTAVPREKPLIVPVNWFLPVVSFSRTFSRLPPARFFREAPMRFIPNRNKPTPPSNVKIEKKSKINALLSKISFTLTV